MSKKKKRHAGVRRSVKKREARRVSKKGGYAEVSNKRHAGVRRSVGYAQVWGTPKCQARWGTPKCQKKKRCLLIWHKRPIDIGQQRPIHRSKETDSQGKRGLFRLAYLRGGRREDCKGRDPSQARGRERVEDGPPAVCPNKPPREGVGADIAAVGACVTVSKEACSYGKRGLFVWQTRPIHVAKEAY